MVSLFKVFIVHYKVLTYLINYTIPFSDTEYKETEYSTITNSQQVSKEIVIFVNITVQRYINLHN